MQSLFTHELSYGQSSVLEQPTGIGPGVGGDSGLAGVGCGGIGVGFIPRGGGRVVGLSASGDIGCEDAGVVTPIGEIVGLISE